MNKPFHKTELSETRKSEEISIITEEKIRFLREKDKIAHLKACKNEKNFYSASYVNADFYNGITYLYEVFSADLSIYRNKSTEELKKRYKELGKILNQKSLFELNAKKDDDKIANLEKEIFNLYIEQQIVEVIYYEKTNKELFKNL